MITTTAATLTTLAATAISAGMGVYSSIQQGKAQDKQAKYQADVARRNQQLAEEQAGAERREGYEAMIGKRQETARLIGRQRAAAGAGGAALDVGANLDLQADTAAQGEMDALDLYNAGLDQAYNTMLQARGYGQRASAHDAQASSARSSGYLNAASSAIGGIAQMGSTWGTHTALNPDPKPAKTTSWLIHPDRRVG